MITKNEIEHHRMGKEKIFIKRDIQEKLKKFKEKNNQLVAVGDEGKGKAIDYLSGNFDVVVRYQGGHNAGHTIYYKDKKVILHLIPSGIFTPDTLSVIGNNVVINPLELTKEINYIQELGLDPNSIVISSNAPLIFPFHEKLDIIFEKSRYTKIGTTKRGIGPAYEDLVGRRSLFTRDLLLDRDKFYSKVLQLNNYYNGIIKLLGGEPINIDSYFDQYLETAKSLGPLIKNTVYILNDNFKKNKNFLFEGAQGTLLDINFGTYPFVTSSNTTIGGLFSGSGLSHKALDKVIGISKAYTTRVGSGPFPSELFDKEADYLREKGGEYGSTTGRPRRVGWLDLVALRYAVMLNGVDEIFLTKLDVLDGFSKIKVITDYKNNHQTSREFDPHMEFMESISPVAKTMAGWENDTSKIREYELLPEQSKLYIKFIEEYLEIPVSYVSIGKKKRTNHLQIIDRQ